MFLVLLYIVFLFNVQVVMYTFQYMKDALNTKCKTSSVHMWEYICLSNYKFKYPTCTYILSDKRNPWLDLLIAVKYIG